MTGTRLSLEQIKARSEERRARQDLRVKAVEQAARLAKAGCQDAIGDDWAEIPGFGGAYDVSLDGRVRSWKAWAGDVRPLPRELKVQTNRHGVRMIQLGLHGGTHRIDALIERAFGKGESDG